MKITLSTAIKNGIISIVKSIRNCRKTMKENAGQIILSIGIGGLLCSLFSIKMLNKISVLHDFLYQMTKVGNAISVPLSIPIIFSFSLLMVLAGMLYSLPSQHHAQQKCLLWFCLYSIELGTIAITVARGQLFYGYWIASISFTILSVYIIIDLARGLRDWAKDGVNSYDIGKLSLIWAVIAAIIGIMF